MFKVWVHGWSLVAVTLLLASSSASAAPAIYAFDTGSAVLTVTLDDGLGTNVLAGGGVVNITLDGSQVVFDPLASANGTLLSLLLADAGPININLDQTLVALVSVTIINAVLSNAAGSTAALSGSGSFFIDTEMAGTVSGVFPDTSTFGPVAALSLTSGASGTLGLSPGQLMLGIFGINIATFPQIANPGAPDLLIKADFTFIGTLIPEPGTALLLGLGLLGLGATQRSR